MKEIYQFAHLTLLCIAFCLFTAKDVAANNAIYKFDFPSDTKASLLIIGPDLALYSRLGHCALRIQTDSLNMDYVYSFESEGATSRVMKFLIGDLKMGMFATPTQKFIDAYRPTGRYIHQYDLNLPAEASIKLWKIIDGYAYLGADLKYDYLERGCAYSTFSFILQACQGLNLEIKSWPEKITKHTRRELTNIALEDHQWTMTFLNLITNGVIDDNCPNVKKVIVPAYLVEVMHATTLNGKRIMAEKYVELAPQSLKEDKVWITPLGVALIILALTLLSILINGKYHSFSIMTYLLLTIQTLLGTFSLYLVAFSSLPCTEWSWLLVPFNPLPLILWKWRKKWSLAFAVIILLWIIGAVVYPHKITTWPYITLAAALAADYLYLYFPARKAAPIAKPTRPRKHKK